MFRDLGFRGLGFRVIGRVTIAVTHFRGLMAPIRTALNP